MKRYLKHPELHGKVYRTFTKVPLAVVGFLVLAVIVIIGFYILQDVVIANLSQRLCDFNALTGLKSVANFDPDLARSLATKEHIDVSVIPTRPNPLALRLVPSIKDQLNSIHVTIDNIRAACGQGWGR